MNHLQHRLLAYGLAVLAAVAALLSAAAPAHAQATKPNIVVIMGDDIGIWNIGAPTIAA